MLTREVFDMTARAQIMDMVKLIPDAELPILLEVVKRFVPTDIDDMATPDDIAACKQAMKEYATEQTVSHDAIDWD